MSGVELKEPKLVARLECVANVRTESAEHILEIAMRQYFDALDAEVIHVETQAFWAMHASLQTRYPDEHVAIHNAEVVDHDVDVRRLEARIRERFGLTPVQSSRSVLWVIAQIIDALGHPETAFTGHW